MISTSQTRGTHHSGGHAMRGPCDLQKAAALLGTTRPKLIARLDSAGWIRRDPYTDRIRAHREGVREGVVIEVERSFRHPDIGWRLYPKVKVTAEGLRRLQELLEEPAA